MLTRQRPTDFGLPLADARANTLLIRTATPAGDAFASLWMQQAAEIRMGTKAVTLPRPSVATTLRSASRSFTEIDHVLQDAIGPKAMDLPDWQLIFTTEPDFANNRAIITIDRMSDPLLFALAARFGTDILAVRVEQRPIVRAAVGRTADDPPFWGGARINVPAGGCTSGFPWITGTQSQMLTAGHCAPDGGSVSTPSAFMGSVTSSSMENWNNGTGTVPFAGQTALRGDLALVDVTNGSSGNHIYRGDWQSSSSSWVAGKGGSPVVGESVCSGGAYSGDQCSFIVSRVGVQVTYNFGLGVARYMVEASRSYGGCVQSGDSGGPVFTTNPDTSVMAKGVIGAFAGTGASGDPCMTWFTDIWDAYWGLPGDIKTQ